MLTRFYTRTFEVLFSLFILALVFFAPSPGLSQSAPNGPQLDAAIAAFEHSDISQAQALVREYLELHPQSAAAWNLKGMIDDSRKDFESGGKDFETALKLAPSASAYTNLGNHFLLLREPDHARRAFENALKLDTGHFSARFNLVNLVMNAPGCHADEIARLQTPFAAETAGGAERGQASEGAHDAAPAPACARDALALIKGFSAGEINRPEVAALEVRVQLAAGQRDAAIQSAKRAMAGSPDNSKLAYSLGLEIARAGEARRALPFFEHAASLMPAGHADPHLLLGLGEAKFQAGLPAASEFRRASELEPGWWQPHYYLGLIAAQSKSFMQAGSEFIKAQQLAPSQALIAAALANVASAQGFWFDAADEWRRYIQLKPDDLRAYRELAIVEGVARRPELGIADMQRYLKAYPDDAEAYYMLALMDQDGDRDQEAIQALQTCVRLKPNYAPGWTTLARDELNFGQVELAKTHLDRALKIDPNYAAAHAALGEIENRQGHPDLAVPLLKKAIQEDPNNVAAYYQLASAERRTGHPEEAQKAAAAFERLHKLTTTDSSGRGLLAYLKEDAKLTPREQQQHYLEFLKNALKVRPDDPRLLCRLGVAQIAGGQKDSGVELVKRALQPSLPYDDALATARALRANGQDELALSFYRLAATLPAATADARAALGEARALLALGHPRKALAILDSVPSAAQPQGEAADLAGLIYARLGMTRQALAAFRVAIGLNPHEETFYRDAAIFLGSHGQWNTALQLLDAAQKQCGSSASLRLDEAVFLQLSGQRAQAQTLLKEMAFHADDPALTPQQRMAALLLGISYYTTDSKSDAARIFDQLTRSDPRLALAWYYRALLASESGRTSEALEWLARSLAIEPEYPRALYLRGKLLADAGNLVDAQRDLEEAASGDPDWSAPHYQLSQVYRQMGKSELAAKEAKAVAQLDAQAHGSQSSELREYLDGLTLASER